MVACHLADSVHLRQERRATSQRPNLESNQAEYCEYSKVWLSLDLLTTTPATVNSLRVLSVCASCLRSVFPSETTIRKASTRGPTSNASSVRTTGGRSSNTQAFGERSRICASKSLKRGPASSSEAASTGPSAPDTIKFGKVVCARTSSGFARPSR